MRINCTVKGLCVFVLHHIFQTNPNHPLTHPLSPPVCHSARSIATYHWTSLIKEIHCAWQGIMENNYIGWLPTPHLLQQKVVGGRNQWGCILGRCGAATPSWHNEPAHMQRVITRQPAIIDNAESQMQMMGVIAGNQEPPGWTDRYNAGFRNTFVPGWCPRQDRIGQNIYRLRNNWQSIPLGVFTYEWDPTTVWLVSIVLECSAGRTNHDIITLTVNHHHLVMFMWYMQIPLICTATD